METVEWIGEKELSRPALFPFNIDHNSRLRLTL